MAAGEAVRVPDALFAEQHKNWHSSHHVVLAGTQRVAQIAMSSWRDRATVTVAGKIYAARPDSFWRRESRSAD
jgi:hypothetical protein